MCPVYRGGRGGGRGMREEEGNLEVYSAANKAMGQWVPIATKTYLECVTRLERNQSEVGYNQSAAL